MTQAQQSEAQRLAAICETKGMFPVADELNRMHARILELEQGKCLHQIAEPEATHPDDAAVDNLAAAMKAKLAKQRAKGYGGWDTDCTQEHLSDLLRAHVNKGDPVDVANFCAFLLTRGEGIATTQPAAQAVPVLYVSKGQLDNHRDPDGVDTDGAGRYLPARKTPKGNFTAPLYERPAPAAQGLDSAISEAVLEAVKAINRGNGDGRAYRAALGWIVAHLNQAVARSLAVDPSGKDALPIATAIAAQAKQGGADHG